MRGEVENAGDVARVAPPPIGEVLRTQWRRVLQIAGFKVLESVGFYLMFVYSATYLTEIVGIAKSRALAINTIGMAAAVLMLPVAGALSGRVWRQPIVLLSVGAVNFFSLAPFTPLLRALFPCSPLRKLSF